VTRKHLSEAGRHLDMHQAPPDVWLVACDYGGEAIVVACGPGEALDQAERLFEGSVRDTEEIAALPLTAALREGSGWEVRARQALQEGLDVK